MTRRLLLLARLLACVLVAGACNADLDRASDPRLPAGDDETVAFEPGVTVDDLAPVVERGLDSRGKAALSGQEYQVGVDSVRFIVLRAGERHGADYRLDAFHCVVGAGVDLPEGALVLRRDWGTPGLIDGNNEQPQVWGLAVAIEPYAPKPFSEKVERAVAAFVQAVTRHAPVHPDCVLAMEEVPYTNHHEADQAERALAAAVRRGVPLPPAEGRLVIHTEQGPVEVRYEHRKTTPGIRVGMMMRRGFDGEDRGMLFEYPHRATRNFWMRNCFIPIDLAYLKQGVVEQIETMEPGAGKDQRTLPYYSSDTPVKYALEMPAGWFAAKGVKVGDRFELK